MKKKVLIIDDSALMRRMWRDIIETDDRFEAGDYAVNGAEGFKRIVAGNYDAVVLDVYMPQMTGLQMLEEMQKSNVRANVLMASTTTREGARETLTALELGAIDFITKPENVADLRAHGIEINTWTVNEEEHIGWMMDAKVDGIIGNYPDRVKKLLKERGLR